MIRQLACLVAALLPLASNAQGRPEPGDAAAPAAHRLVVPVEPGGGIDAVARLLANAWSTEMSLPTIVVNRPGASGNIGTASVAKSKPDGQTLLVTGVGHITSAMLHENPGYHPFEDFTPIARFATAPNVMLVSDALKGMPLAQILSDPRSRNQGFSYSSAGYGHSSHMAAHIFATQTGVKWLHVPFKGTSPGLRALLAGETHIMFVTLGSVQAALATHRVHAVAVTHHERLQVLPDVPTLSELGIKNAEFAQWYGMFAPRGTPPSVVKSLSEAAVGALKGSAMTPQFKTQGLEPAPLRHDEFERFLKAESRRLEKMLDNRTIDRPVN
ncbi:tripartite tricarboxylate transporter substrate binding protein [Ramlibacter sp. WS9]|uniref:tripartite tricarboxylate transporter substrate binding protein n=1 Tax=Ramlibacter sp. WS9 TaxID=1882741 RepID=UPI0013050D2A|nr:tripartite tricarboxylate transporter substrate binding protein [Ramlibacter sp. WS9]